MATDPLNMFLEWYASAHVANILRHPEAVCLSTVDEHGMPQARFVDLKETTEAGFVFCTQHDSPKALALAQNAKAALAFWWDHVERQIRVVGSAQRIADAQSDLYFRQRPRDAQLASWACQQSALLEDPAALKQKLRARHDQFTGGEIPRPPNWGGYVVVPSRIEFLSFRANRMHERLLFTRDGARWHNTWLEP